MPDLDVLGRPLAFGWDGPHKLLVEDGSVEQIARASMHALTRTLRDRGGIPRFGELVSILRSGLRDGPVVDRDVSIPQDKQLPLRAMLTQVASLRADLDRPDAWQALSDRHPQLLEIAEAARDSQSDAMPSERITDLYRRYCAEWERFPIDPAFAGTTPAERR